MAGIKISALPAISVPALTDIFPVVQSGVTYKETCTQLGTLFGFTAGILAPSAGGTGVANTGTITIGGNFTMSGAFTFTGTLTGNTAVTFPTSGTLATTAAIPSFPLSLANGGTGANLTAVNGGIVYSNASTFAVSAAGSAGQILRSVGAGIPVWSTSTFPATAGTTGNIIISDGTNYISSTSLWPNTVGAAGKLLRSDGTNNTYTTLTFPDTIVQNAILFGNVANNLGPITPAASSALVSDVSSVPSWSQTLPSAVQTNITALGAQSQALNMNSHLINNVTDPVSAQDAATKNYVDLNALNGTSVYAASAATLGTVTQSGAGVGATLTNAGVQATFALDGVNPPVGTNVLIKNTATGMSAANEGIYTVTSVGSGATNWVLTRATSYDTSTEINNTGLILVQNGSTLVGTAWYNSSTIVTVDTTNFSYSQFGNITFPVSLANGGTEASLTASNGGIFYSNASTGAILAGTATAGLALLSGASTTPSWSSSPPFTRMVVQTFTSGTTTYTPTSGMKTCIVEIVGAGGSGGGVTGGTAGQGAAAGGGGGGGYCRRLYTAANIGASASVVIGAGGVAATSGANNGNAGGTSSFTPSGGGATLTCTGGGAGVAMAKSASAQVTSGGNGGTGTGGNINITGSVGGLGATLAAGALVISGSGGAAPIFGNTVGILPWTTTGSGGDGNTATGFGSGSGGAWDINSGDHASNIGGSGYCIVTEFLSV